MEIKFIPQTYDLTNWTGKILLNQMEYASSENPSITLKIKNIFSICVLFVLSKTKQENFFKQRKLLEKKIEVLEKKIQVLKNIRFVSLNPMFTYDIKIQDKAAVLFDSPFCIKTDENNFKFTDKTIFHLVRNNISLELVGSLNKRLIPEVFNQEIINAEKKQESAMKDLMNNDRNHGKTSSTASKAKAVFGLLLQGLVLVWIARETYTLVTTGEVTNGLIYTTLASISLSLASQLHKANTKLRKIKQQLKHGVA